MVRYIASSSVNWADEMDISYSHVYTAKERKDALSNLKLIQAALKEEYQDNYDPDDIIVCIGIGTNEELDVSINDAFDFLYSMEKITETEYKVLKKFGFTCMGPDLYSCFAESDNICEQLSAYNKRKLEVAKIKSKRKRTPEEKATIRKEKQFQDFKNFLKED